LEGNALIAVQMTTHDARAGLYVPLRLFVQEIAKSRVMVTYDLPSATMIQRPLIKNVQLDGPAAEAGLSRVVVKFRGAAGCGRPLRGCQRTRDGRSP
jgi:hypothetical protein